MSKEVRNSILMVLATIAFVLLVPGLANAGEDADCSVRYNQTFDAGAACPVCTAQFLTLSDGGVGAPTTPKLSDGGTCTACRTLSDAGVWAIQTRTDGGVYACPPPGATLIRYPGDISLDAGVGSIDYHGLCGLYAITAGSSATPNGHTYISGTAPVCPWPVGATVLMQCDTAVSYATTRTASATDFVVDFGRNPDPYVVRLDNRQSVISVFAVDGGVGSCRMGASTVRTKW